MKYAMQSKVMKLAHKWFREQPPEAHEEPSDVWRECLRDAWAEVKRERAAYAENVVLFRAVRHSASVARSVRMAA